MRTGNRIDTYLESHLDESIAELGRLCALPSVAAQNWGLEKCATLVEELLSQRGFTTEIITTPGAPVVFAEKAGRNPGTLLFYDHYDVQPPEPLDLWTSPPFELTRREDKLYARGVSDNKGHLASRLFALSALLEVEGELPCTVKFVIEGEEEISSPHITKVIQDNREKFSADSCIWEFGGVDHRDIPMQILGVRGICYVELSAQTANSDVHSGLGGSIFPNAAWRLIWALNTIKDQDETIHLPGFYDRIREPSDCDRELLAALPDLADQYYQQYGVKEFLSGVKGGVELQLAKLFQPSCTICGLQAGYQGAGSKTVLPAQASAKVDFRLIPDQHPDDVVKGLRQHLDDHGFPDVEVFLHGGTPPARTDPDDPFVSLVMDAAEPVYGHRGQIVPFTGGSGPNYAFRLELGVPIATAGIGYPGANGHAPNENIRLDLYLKGAKHIARILQAFGTRS